MDTDDCALHSQHDNQRLEGGLIIRASVLYSGDDLNDNDVLDGRTSRHHEG